LGNDPQTPPNISQSIAPNGRLLGLARRKHIDLLPQHHNLCLERCARPYQIDHRPKDQFAQIQHRAAASRDSRSTASGLNLRQGQEDQNDNSAKSDRVSRMAGSRYTVDRAGLIAAPHKKIILFQYGIAKLPLRTSGVTAKDVALTDEPPSSGDQIHLALVMFDHDHVVI
jgi:hypothetical protein